MSNKLGDKLIRGVLLLVVVDYLSWAIFGIGHTITLVLVGLTVLLFYVALVMAKRGGQG